MLFKILSLSNPKKGLTFKIINGVIWINGNGNRKLVTDILTKENYSVRTLLDEFELFRTKHSPIFKTSQSQDSLDLNSLETLKKILKRELDLLTSKTGMNQKSIKNDNENLYFDNFDKKVDDDKNCSFYHIIKNLHPFIINKEDLPIEKPKIPIDNNLSSIKEDLCKKKIVSNGGASQLLDKAYQQQADIPNKLNLDLFNNVSCIRKLLSNSKFADNVLIINPKKDIIIIQLEKSLVSLHKSSSSIKNPFQSQHKPILNASFIDNEHVLTEGSDSSVCIWRYSNSQWHLKLAFKPCELKDVIFKPYQKISLYGQLLSKLNKKQYDSATLIQKFYKNVKQKLVARDNRFDMLQTAFISGVTLIDQCLTKNSGLSHKKRLLPVLHEKIKQIKTHPFYQKHKPALMQAWIIFFHHQQDLNNLKELTISMQELLDVESSTCMPGFMNTITDVAKDLLMIDNIEKDLKEIYLNIIDQLVRTDKYSNPTDSIMYPHYRRAMIDYLIGEHIIPKSLFRDIESIDIYANGNSIWDDYFNKEAIINQFAIKFIKKVEHYKSDKLMQLNHTIKDLLSSVSDNDIDIDPSVLSIIDREIKSVAKELSDLGFKSKRQPELLKMYQESPLSGLFQLTSDYDEIESINYDYLLGTHIKFDHVQPVKVQAAINIQKLARGYQIKKWYRSLQMPATRIQTAYRRAVAIKKMKQLRKSIIKMQTLFRMTKAKQELHQLRRLKQNNAALVIQRAVNSVDYFNQIFSVIKLKTRSSICIQSLYRQYKAKEEFTKLKQAKRTEDATKLQAMVRGINARTKLRRLISKNRSATKIQQFYRVSKAKEKLKRRIESAIKIQKTIRSYLERRHDFTLDSNLEGSNQITDAGLDYVPRISRRRLSVDDVERPLGSVSHLILTDREYLYNPQ
ncbi:hypothetical protein DID75_05905, partial [Candidatus Marinamargulisbacteria bacterium SCGC AG-410-N11]